MFCCLCHHCPCFILMIALLMYRCHSCHACGFHWLRHPLGTCRPAHNAAALSSTVQSSRLGPQTLILTGRFENNFVPIMSLVLVVLQTVSSAKEGFFVLFDKEVFWVGVFFKRNLTKTSLLVSPLTRSLSPSPPRSLFQKL